ncbi:MAG: hypothetical protein K8R21_01110 [Leptospira sp.]|nr:hypothetical protein [Leptospira sp.]
MIKFLKVLFWGITFYVGVFFRKSGTVSRISWIALTMILGNIPITFCGFLKLFKLQGNDGPEKLLLR